MRSLSLFQKKELHHYPVYFKSKNCTIRSIPFILSKATKSEKKKKKTHAPKAGVKDYTYETFYKEYIASLIWITEWFVVCSVSQFMSPSPYHWGTNEEDVEGGLTQKEIRVRHLWNAVAERVFYGCIREKVLPVMKEVCG